MIRSLRLALLMNLCILSIASAQPAPAGPESFSARAVGQRITVISDSGVETKGRLLRFDAESLAIAVAGREVVFQRQDVAKVLARGDSLSNGMKTGAISGGAFGLFIGLMIAGVADSAYHSYTPAAQIGMVAAPTSVFALIGMGAGAGIDALFTRQRVVYERPKVPPPVAVFLMPVFAPSRTGLSMGVSW